MEAGRLPRKLVLLFIVLALVLVPVTSMAGGGSGGVGTKGEDPDGWARPDPTDGLGDAEVDPLVNPSGSNDSGPVSAVRCLLLVIMTIR